MAHFLVYNTSDPKRADTLLGGGASVTVGQIQTEQEGAIVGTVKSDQAGTLFVDQSFDGSNWDYSASYPVTANTGVKVSESVIAPFVQVRYTNGATPQAGFLRIFVRSFGTKTG